ncbi:hypothetical protein Trydic_g16820 [Trypoxylus dichotomus]
MPDTNCRKLLTELHSWRRFCGHASTKRNGHTSTERSGCAPKNTGPNINLRSQQTSHYTSEKDDDKIIESSSQVYYIFYRRRYKMIFDIYMRSDMLSSRKVKLHGMSTSRWTVKDKIVQHKGLIHLYRRDKKVAIIDKNIAIKKDRNTVLTLKKKIALARLDLDNVTFGNRESIQKALDEKQLSYQDLHIDKVIEHISQNNFNFRKQLDLLHYRKVVKSKMLINLTTEVAELQDRIPASGQLPIEIQSKILTAQVHDVNLKMEASIVINESYKKIISVCKKDAIYFDVILESLRGDRNKQGKCMLNTIILGQLATEYLFDRREEFQLLEKIVKRDMDEREKEFAEIAGEVKKCNQKLKFLIRRDSDITLPVKNDFTNADIRVHIRTVCNMLDILKDSFFANSYSELINCLRDQRYHKERLKQLQERFLEGRDVLLNKITHAQLGYDELHNTMIETTFDTCWGRYENRKFFSTY